MKTYSRDFSISNTALIKKSDELEEVMSYRQEKMHLTSEYQIISSKLEKIIENIKELLSKDTKTIDKLEDAILDLECMIYSAAYKDGMGDLMTTITLNNLHLTKAEYFSKDQEI